MGAKRIFISMIDGLDNAAILAEKEWLSGYIKSIVGNNIDTVFDYIVKDPKVTTYNQLTHLGGSLAILSTCDYLYISQNASDCQRCQIEKAAAQAYGIPIIKDLNKRIELDSYVIDIDENQISIGMRYTKYNEYYLLFQQRVSHYGVPDFYDQALKLINEYNKKHDLEWNEFPETVLRSGGS